MFSNHRFSKRYILWESQSIFNFYEMIYFPSVHPSILLQYNKLLPFILPSTPWLSLPFNAYRTLLHTNLVLRLGQARHSFTNIFHIFYLTLLLYPTIDSALAPYYLSLFCYYGLIFLPEAETLYYLVLLLRILLHLVTIVGGSA